MPSSAAARRRNEAAPPPAPHPEAVEHAMGPAHAAAPRLPPPAVFARRLDAAPYAAAVERARGALPWLPPPASFQRNLDPAPCLVPPNPSPPEAQACTATPPPLPSSSPSSSSRRRRCRNRGRKEVEARDWAALPLDVISAILRKLDHIEILMGPGKVCRSWRRAARDEPALWRRIDMRGHPELDRRVDLYGMAQAAIRRAQGQCEAFWAEYAADDDVLKLLGEQAPSLKSLRLICCQDIVEFEEEIKKFPLLQELEISLFTNIGGKHVFEEVGKACLELKHFRFNRYRFYNSGNVEYSDDDDSEFRYNKDDDALGIATMHGLRSLQLFGHDFTNEALTAIIGNCPHWNPLTSATASTSSWMMPCAQNVQQSRRRGFLMIQRMTMTYSLRALSGQLPGLVLTPTLMIVSMVDLIIFWTPMTDDYCDPLRYLDGVYESELCLEDRMFLKGMRMLIRDDDDDDY